MECQTLVIRSGQCPAPDLNTMDADRSLLGASARPGPDLYMGLTQARGAIIKARIGSRAMPHLQIGVLTNEGIERDG